MHSDRYYPVRRARVLSQALERENHTLAVAVAYALASAIIVLWMAYLSSVTGAILSKLNILPEHLTLSETVNRDHKGDRLAKANFDETWNNIVAVLYEPAVPHRAEKVLDGCESGFASFVQGISSARCVTSIAPHTTLANATGSSGNI